MIEMNQKMSKEFKKVQWEKLQVNRKLLKIIELGFFTTKSCFLLTHFKSQLTLTSRNDFPDKTGFEHFVNSIHIDDYYKGKDQLGQGLIFFKEVFKNWNEEHSSKVLIGTLSKNKESHDVRISMHVQRSGERMLGKNLEEYLQEGILMVDSKEPTFSH